VGGPRKKIQELEDVKMVGQNIKTMIRWRQHESSIFKDFFLQQSDLDQIKP